MAEPVTIGEIERNPTEILRVSNSSYKNKEYVDIRIFYTTDGTEWKPTKKGVTVSIDALDKLIEHLKKAKETLEKK